MHACKGGQQQLLACPEPGGPQEAPDAVVALVAQCGGGAVRSSDCGRCGISHTFLTVMMEGGGRGWIQFGMWPQHEVRQNLVR